MLTTIITVLTLIVLIVIWSLLLYKKDQKEIPIQRKVTKTYNKPIEDASLEEIASRVAKEKLSPKELRSLFGLVAKKFKIPVRNSSKSSEPHFKFIHQFCLNKAVDGALIVQMTNTFKAVNNSYKEQIEETEKKAVRERDLNSR